VTETHLRRYVRRHHSRLIFKSILLALFVYFVGTFPVVTVVHFSALSLPVKAVIATIWAAVMAFIAEWGRGNYWDARMNEFYVELSKNKWRTVGTKTPPQSR
jgi:hypothetical protein